MARSAGPSLKASRASWRQTTRRFFAHRSRMRASDPEPDSLACSLSSPTDSDPKPSLPASKEPRQGSSTSPEKQGDPVRKMPCLAAKVCPASSRSSTFPIARAVKQSQPPHPSLSPEAQIKNPAAPSQFSNRRLGPATDARWPRSRVGDLAGPSVPTPFAKSLCPARPTPNAGNDRKRFPNPSAASCSAIRHSTVRQLLSFAPPSLFLRFSPAPLSRHLQFAALGSLARYCSCGLTFSAPDLQHAPHPFLPQHFAQPLLPLIPQWRHKHHARLRPAVLDQRDFARASQLRRRERRERRGQRRIVRWVRGEWRRRGVVCRRSGVDSESRLRT